MKRKIFIFILAFITSAGAMFADSVMIGDLYYNLDSVNFTAEVTSMPSGLYTGDIVIPPSIAYSAHNYTVTSIGDTAFYECKNLTSIEIPNSVTNIGKHAFYHCSSLTNLELPNSINSIGIGAFSYCSGLTSIELPSSITIIKNAAFEYCLGLTEIEIPNNVDSIGLRVFGGCKDLRSIVVASENPKYDSRNNCNAIIETTSNTLISGCKNTLIPSSVTSIGDYAFYRCSNLSSITIPNNVTSIGKNAFYYCSSLTSIEIPNSVSKIGENAFVECSSLISVYIDDLSAWCGIAFSNNRSNPLSTSTSQIYLNGVEVTDLIIPNSVTNIGDYAFYQCSSLSSITIPNNVTSIGKNAFYNIPYIVYNGTATGSPWGAKNIYHYREGWLAYSDSTKTIIERCFPEAYGEIIIPNGVISIGYRAFYECTSLTSIIIPNSVTSIGEDAFRLCTSLDSVIVGENVMSLGRSVFNGCENIKSVQWNAKNFRQQKPNNDSNGFPFYSARNNITSFTFGDSVQYIPAYLVKDISSITEINIPNKVTEIGDYALYGCKNLVSITIGENLSTIGQEIFPQNANLEIYVPCGTLDSYKTLLVNYVDNIKYAPFPYTVTILPAVYGHVSTIATICDEEAIYTIWATPDDGYHFTQWSDGNTENPRVVTLTQDSIFTAEFAFDKSGTCGENLALIWTYEDENKTLTISGEGALTSNYTFGLEAPNSVERLIISEGVTAIGSNAFANYSTLKHISIAASVKTIYEQAFYNCTGLEEIFSYRSTPAMVYSNSFDGIDKFNCTLHVLSVAVDMYKAATGWRDFYYVETIDATEITEPVVNVTIIPTESTAEITWPIVVGSLSYEIVITKDNEVVCTLIFNAAGQLTGIAFAPSRNRANSQDATGFRFTVTGLTSSTQYGYSIVAKDANEQTLDTKSGSFTTTGAVPTKIDNFTDDAETSPQKVLNNGQIYILRGNKIYTTSGQQVK